jgi:NAD(P)-dependent dehydrogenase (short-subunit alcohol dehydrogenase family)
MSLVIDLVGKKAIVTGVTQGIGAAIARRLAEAGADVAGCALEVSSHLSAKRFLSEVRMAGREGFYVEKNLSSPEGPSEFVAEAVNFLGGIDVVVANAGRNVFGGVAECTEEEWANCLQLDLGSHWRLARSAKLHLDRSSAASVIFISSNHAFETLPGCFPYNVAKAGINAMVQSIALEWGPAIRAIGIAPGFIDTPGNDQWFASFPDPMAKRRQIAQKHPAGRLGKPEEIGALCAFLASEHARFITGTTILVDGGHGADMGW